METILAIDTDITVHEQQTAAWAKVGINTSRADTMSEAILRLIRNDDYIFVAINEDTIDYLPKLQTMREVTNLPIFVITSDYSTEKKIAAIKAGADVYDPFSKFTQENVTGALELLELQKRWMNRKIKPASVLVGGDVILSTKRRIVFVRDTEISFHKKEFDILRHLIINKGQVLTHAQLIHKVWGDSLSANENALWQTIKRLRQKLSEVSPDTEYITVEREVGYKFLE